MKNFNLEDFGAFSVEVLHRLESIEKLLSERKEPIEELIDRKTLCARLGVSVPTIIRMERKGLPHRRNGSRAQYDYHEVKNYLKK